MPDAVTTIGPPRATDNGDVLAAAVELLCARAARLRWHRVSPSTREHTLRVFADTVAVAVAGATDPVVGRLIRDEGGLGGAPGVNGGQAVLLVRGGPRADAATAAWLNGTACTFLEFDEGQRPTGHPAAHVVPASLAAAQALHVDGVRLLEGVIAGYEVAARLFDTFALRYPLHPHGHIGAVAAATAVAVIRGIDPLPSVRVAATQPLLTTWHACYVGATARNTWAGDAARTGVVAHTLADAGFTGATANLTSALAGPIADLIAPETLAEPATEDRLRIAKNYLKLHSSCALTHCAVDAALTAASDGVAAEAVRKIDVITVSANLKVARLPAANALSTRFSLPYAVAAALFHRHAGPSAFVWNPDVARLAERVDVRADPGLDHHWPSAAPTRMVITTDTESIQYTVDNPAGHHARPATDLVADKFVELVTAAAGIDKTHAQHRYRALLDLPSLSDCADLDLPV